jgi:hypothetical protein
LGTTRPNRNAASNAEIPTLITNAAGVDREVVIALRIVPEEVVDCHRRGGERERADADPGLAREHG